MERDDKGRFMKGIVPWNKDKINVYSKETLEEMRKIKTGKKFSEEHCKKISNSNKGRISWAKGLRGIKTSNKGMIAWNKGLSPSEETRIKMSLSRKGKHLGIEHHFYGKHHSKESRKLMSEKLKGNIPWNKGIKGLPNNSNTKFKKGLIPWNKGNGEYMSGNKNHFYGKHHSEEFKIKYKELRKTFILPVKDSSIEKKIQNFLTNLKIEYMTHKYIHIEHGYQCDILIPSMNLIIECDGDYWHGNPLRNKELSERQKSQRIKDDFRTKELQEKGFKVLRLWENEINKMNIDNLKNKIEVYK